MIKLKITIHNFSGEDVVDHYTFNSDDPVVALVRTTEILCAFIQPQDLTVELAN